MNPVVTPLNQCSAFIFDMDGTLTVPQHDFDEIRSALDIPQGSLILEHLDGLPNEQRQRKRAQLNQIEAEIAAESQPAPGLFELLQWLRDHKIDIAVLTRNSLDNARISLQAIGVLDMFSKQTLVGREEAEPKPHPAGIELLAHRLGTAPRRCAMIGDYRHDLEAATAAGAHSVHIRHPNTPSWSALTNTTVASLHELLHRLVHQSK